MTGDHHRERRKRLPPCHTDPCGRKCKKNRRLGEPEIVTLDEYEGLALDEKIDLIKALISLGMMRVADVLEEEVTSLAGRR